tara:strand:+ start:615 stop:1823 length:1209 start_codon:yes stop_codon:yes gene_type:complete
MKMKIGVLREEKVPVDKRVVLTPKQCKKVQESYSNVDILVQSSDFRCFTDEEYLAEGITVVDDICACDILLGVKEVPKEFLIANKTYLYFSHTIKEQPYNRDLLVRMLEMRINMIDYEVLKNEEGDRLLGFGRYAGIVGAYNAFLTYGLKSGCYELKPAYECRDRIEMEDELSNLIFNNERIVVTGRGRVGRGIMEVMRCSGIKEVSVDDFLHQIYDEPVFVHLDTMDYNEKIDGSFSNKSEFYNNPESYQSSFVRFARVADIFIAGHYYSSGSPYLFTREDAKSNNFNLKVVADISCDIDGPVASTIRSSIITDPIYGYDPITEKEVPFQEEGAIAVMAVSNLPCELPKDASEDFGNELLEKIIPCLIHEDIQQIISDATICSAGDLTSNFEYLRNYINGS